MGFKRPQLREVSSTLCAKLVSDRSREVYKYVPYPRQFALQSIQLTLQSRAGLCLVHLISSPLSSSTGLSNVVTFIGYIVDQQARQCL
jgi:hypothetical protein